MANKKHMSTRRKVINGYIEAHMSMAQCELDCGHWIAARLVSVKGSYVKTFPKTASCYICKYISDEALARHGEAK